MNSVSAQHKLFLFAAVFCLFIGGCRQTEPARQSQILEQRLLNQFERWQGTPYRLGGQNLQGVDCSAFVMRVYRDEFGIEIPRTTRDQLRAGNAVNPRRLQVGDMVFFRTGRNTLHVGIVLREGRFMHASVTRGVIIDELNQSYWRQRFIGARRVF